MDRNGDNPLNNPARRSFMGASLVAASGLVLPAGFATRALPRVMTERRHGAPERGHDGGGQGVDRFDPSP